MAKLPLDPLKLPANIQFVVVEIGLDQGGSPGTSPRCKPKASIST
jgi:hypothetical protein